MPGSARTGPPTWRPTFGTAEDRNQNTLNTILLVQPWRPTFGTAEDRNHQATVFDVLYGGWRPTFGTAEDRNSSIGQ